MSTRLIRTIKDLYNYDPDAYLDMHFFCVENTYAKNHKKCKARIFTEEEWTELLYTSSEEYMLVFRTKMADIGTNTLALTDIHTILTRYGRLCRMSLRMDMLLEALKRCDRIYKQRILAEAYLCEGNSSPPLDEVVKFFETCGSFLLPNFCFINDPTTFHTAYHFYLENCKLKEELRQFRKDMLIKHTPIATDVCEQIGEFL